MLNFFFWLFLSKAYPIWMDPLHPQFMWFLTSIWWTLPLIYYDWKILKQDLKTEKSYTKWFATPFSFTLKLKLLGLRLPTGQLAHCTSGTGRKKQAHCCKDDSGTRCILIVQYKNKICLIARTLLGLTLFFRYTKSHGCPHWLLCIPT